MKYNVRVSVDTQARVFNFTSNIDSAFLLENLLSKVAKENYKVEVSKGCKKHRGKAYTFEEIVKVVGELRFTKKKHVLEIKITTEWEKLFDFYLPFCGIYQCLKDWGTFFDFIPSEDTCIKPDYIKIKTLFVQHGLDWNIALSNNRYTHNRIRFSGNGVITVEKEVNHYTYKKEIKTIIL